MKRTDRKQFLQVIVRKRAEHLGQLKALLAEPGLDRFAGKLGAVSLAGLLVMDADALEDFADDASMRRAHRRKFRELIETKRTEHQVGRTLAVLLAEAGLGQFARKLGEVGLDDLLGTDEDALEGFAEDAGMKRTDRKKFLAMITKQRAEYQADSQSGVLDQLVALLAGSGLGRFAPTLEEVILADVPGKSETALQDLAAKSGNKSIDCELFLNMVTRQHAGQKSSSSHADSRGPAGAP